MRTPNIKMQTLSFALIVPVNEVTYNQQALPEDVAGIKWFCLLYVFVLAGLIPVSKWF
jgi:hypothetical protein